MAIQEHQRIYDRDLPLMAAMGVNAIRIYVLDDDEATLALALALTLALTLALNLALTLTLTLALTLALNLGALRGECAAARAAHASDLKQWRAEVS